MARIRTGALLASVLVLTACGAGQGQTNDESTTSPTIPSTVSTTHRGTITTMQSLTPDQTALIGMAIVDLAQRTGADQSNVILVSYRDVTWPDGSLGCPEPGQFYTQALVEGYQIGLRHDDRFFDYHGADGDDPFLCASEDKDGGHGFLPPPGSDVEK